MSSWAWSCHQTGLQSRRLTAAQIRVFLGEHHAALRLGALAGAAAIPIVLVFTVSLARLVRSRQPGSMLPELITGGGILIAALHWLLAATASMTLV